MNLIIWMASILIFITLYWNGATLSNIHSVKTSVTNKIKGKPVGKSNGHLIGAVPFGDPPHGSSRPSPIYKRERSPSPSQVNKRETMDFAMLRMDTAFAAAVRTMCLAHGSGQPLATANRGRRQGHDGS